MLVGMTAKMFSTSAIPMLVLLLFAFPFIGGEGSGEVFGVGRGETSGEGDGEVEGSNQTAVTTFISTTTSTTLAQTLRQAGCGLGNLKASEEGSGSIRSPNYPKKYPSFTECWWTITAPVGYQILIRFTTFELEKCCDFLQVYDALSQAEAAQPYITISSEDVSLASILSDSSYFTIKFTSDQNVQKKGFELTYTATTVKIPCPTLTVPSNARRICYVDKNNKFYCRFSCNKHFKLSGSERRWCMPNGTWTGNKATCDEIATCIELSVPEYGMKRCTDGNNINSTCNFTCDDGYELFGSESRICKLGDVKKPWSGKDTSCQKSPPTPTCDVERENICDGFHNCVDRSDEKGCTCPQYKFKCDCYDVGCPSVFGCIPHKWRCNGYASCSDMSDERNCECSDTRFQCKSGDCIDRSKVNDGRIDCISGDDEFICNKTQDHVSCDCMNDDDRCTSSGRCIPNSWIGDTIPDCENHSDEPCNASKVWCDECWVIINKCSANRSKNVLVRNSLRNKTRCHSLTNPTNPMQLLEANWICITSPCGKCLDVFQCESGQYVDNEHYCDSTQQCNDGSDETVKRFGFRCPGKSRKGDCVLPQRNLYDDVAQCADDSDLCFVNGEFRCFSCLDGKLIVSSKQVCDGIVDCNDMSDECLCADQTVCNAVLGEEKSRCPSNQMHCNTGNDCIDMDEVLCNSSVTCKSGSNQMFCHQDPRSHGRFTCFAMGSAGSRVTITATRCDGRPECYKMEDECNCEPRPQFCEDPCAANASSSGYGNRVCDGIFNQVLTSSQSCNKPVEENCSMRFYCKSKDMISIDKRSVCDGIIDCDDHSDENSTDCRNKRFHCTKGKVISIDKAFVCDGIKDCDQGEDEALELCGENDSLFSDQYEMISNSILLALFWIMGLLALIGNAFTGFNTAKHIFSRKLSSNVKLANHIFVLNLNLSDFLMGIYLFFVAAHAKKYSGYYGKVDKTWRSSNLCSGLGTLVVLSSETSAFLMACMSTLSLITVYNPFISKSIKIKWIVIAAWACWIFSFFLAAIPWFPFDSGYFISDVWFPNLFFKTGTVSKFDMFTIATRASGANIHQSSWFEVKAIVSDAFKYNRIKEEFGYYGGTSVCMPRFYATAGEAAWQYSTFLITLNFLLFIYMVIAYVLVYKKASSMKQTRSKKKERLSGMQKRISRLLLTDFCCWIPVCIMGYMSVAGVSLPANAYLASAGFLLPINSAMNPMLYSQLIGRHASRSRNWMTQNLSSICLCPAEKRSAA